MAMGSRPNILLITSDQHRGDCLDFSPTTGSRHMPVQTPHLRRLAEEGVLFSRFYSEAPVCVPARAILQTGMLPYRSGIFDNANTPPPDEPTLARCLAANGYFTQAIGKMHFKPVRAARGFQRAWISEERPNRLEEDDFLQFLVDAGYGHVEEPHGAYHEMYLIPQVSQVPETHHTTAWTGRKTIEFLREHPHRAADQPFFCWTSFQKPHPPYDPPAPWYRMYHPAAAPAPLKSADELSWLPTSLRISLFQHWVDEFPDSIRLATIWAYYFAALSFVDSWIGMILDELERLGLREDTLVVYTSDHGELMGDHWACEKSCFYDGAARVPCIISWPGAPGDLPRGVVRSQLAGLADVVPTFLDAAGVAPEPAGLRLDGISLLPVARDDAPTRDMLFGHVGGHAGAGDNGAHLMALTDEWKYVYVAGDNRELLFKVGDETHELRNELASGDPEARAAAARLRAALQQRYREGGATELLDEASPNGFRLTPALTYPQMLPSDPTVRSRARQRQFARWIQHLPEGWSPPPAPADGGITPGLPLRSDRARYHWPVLPP